MKILILLLAASLFTAPLTAAAPAPIATVPTKSPLTLSKDEIKELIISYSKAYKIDPALPLAIAFCESGYNHLAKNKHSSASGVFQYLKGTFSRTEAGKAGKSVFDPHANIESAIKHLKAHSPAPWAESKRCWEKLIKT